MRVFVGTSGWYYSWNEDRSLDWFITNAGLNAIELNASHYRFPYPNQVLSWQRKGESLQWSIKVHRTVTHTHQLNEKAREKWLRFRSAFAPLDPLIRFYLFQVPPRYHHIDRTVEFAEFTGLGYRCALELRDPDLLADDAVCQKLQEHMVLVSVDSPDMKNRIFPGKSIYLRMHGRTGWYQHNYSHQELEETSAIIRDLDPDEVYVFFNNDHNMLENAKVMRNLLAM